MELPHEKLRAWGSIFLCLLALAFYSVLMISPSDFNDIDKDYLGSIIMIVSVTTRSFLGLATECFSKSAQSFFKHPVFIFLRALSDFSIMSCCIYAIISFAASLER
ncbi:hypothetical protein TCAL_11708 [Tigriopus californicus]|uniref:Uncharacterized protein n=2 Tax=Tigriopus californicus TaxID=6832 RepID=A0A553NB12_TIGCA|nr:hypothetical protein TCAL_11708 [Tigriopus californicus]